MLQVREGQSTVPLFASSWDTGNGVKFLRKVQQPPGVFGKDRKLQTYGKKTLHSIVKKKKMQVVPDVSRKCQHIQITCPAQI